MKWFILIMPLVVSDSVFNRSSSNNIQFQLEDNLTVKMSACPETEMTPIVILLNYIVEKYLNNCITLILYDDFFYKSLTFQPVILQLLNSFPRPMIHGQFSSEVPSDRYFVRSLLAAHATRCTDYIVLTQTLEFVAEMLGRQTQSKVVMVPQASPWALMNFLESPAADQLVNLLVVADPSLQINTYSQDENIQTDINLYTHELYADPLGSRVPRLLTSWRCDRLTRPLAHLFPTKMATLNGYQLRVVAADKPPYVYQSSKQDQLGEATAEWDGLEIRLLKLISEELNMTLRFHRPSTSSWENTAESVLLDLSESRAEVAVAGVYATADRFRRFRFSSVHSHDCAVFMTLASTALPRYRAILGPFQWGVWVAITLAYLFAIVPLTYSAFHTLRHLLDDPCEIENMFWYVFGTFTNCFTFTGKKSWSGGNMVSTRMFIGAYWAFSIIVSAAYTGSIIAFIMLPAFPEVIETTKQLVDNDFRIVTTNKSHLETTFYNSTDARILELSHAVTIVDTVEEGISNVTDSPFFTQYAFLHSREFLKHVILTNFTYKKTSKKKAFHLSKDCFVPMPVAMMFPPASVLVDRIDTVLARADQGGFIRKLITDVAWDQQKSGSGKLLQISGSGALKLPASERQLTLDDTQGMFLLLAVGFAAGCLAFAGECAIGRRRRRGQVVPSVAVSLRSDENSETGGGNFRFRSYDDSSSHRDSPPHVAEASVHAPPASAQSLAALRHHARITCDRLSV